MGGEEQRGLGESSGRPARSGVVAGELGEKAGVSRPTIARVEANNDVTTATIAKIAHALGLTLQLTDRG